ncbi:hypothetical protein [Kineococcus rhizosphaerae]|uniref:Uncharacterized protein n=1 Tax=Kineococcus rhizosphaerae TaxID=559628 RepID=A0A2T0R8V4_9ACTN|nr:hypothetical protein [Kineococcus rhizosphaerae]PRY17554.1 hypothetical protein CLV37_102517 [Kineococcus rhizosphaerae]
MSGETPGEVPGGVPDDFDFDAEFQKAFGPKKPVRSVIVAGVTQSRVLVDVLAQVDVHAYCVPVKGVGSVLVTEDPATGEADVATLSGAVPQAEFVLFTVGEESIEGQAWLGGRRGEDPKPGLLLSIWPDPVQDLVLGKTDPAEHAVTGQQTRKPAFWKRVLGRDDSSE